jgi:hypothetical protein
MSVAGAESDFQFSSPSPSAGSFALHSFVAGSGYRRCMCAQGVSGDAGRDEGGQREALNYSQRTIQGRGRQWIGNTIDRGTVLRRGASSQKWHIHMKTTGKGSSSRITIIKNSTLLHKHMVIIK